MASAQVFPERSVDVQLKFDGTTNRDRWVAGYLPMYSRAINGATPKVWMYDKNGKKTIPETEILFPDTYYANVWDVTADRSGNLYASMEIWSSAGAGTGAICRVAPGAKKILVVKTDDFRWVSLAAGNNGDIWAFGHPLLLQTVRRTKSEYDTLWHFDSSGRLIEKLLPRSVFGPDLIPTQAFGDLGFPYLRITSARLGVYSATAGRWMEYDLSQRKWVVDVPIVRLRASDGIKPIMADLAMTEPDDSVYAFFVYRDVDATHTSGLYRLDKRNAKWVHIDDGSKEFGGLFGADGSDIILRAGSKTYGWFPEAKFAPMK
ncbi:MAG TPA: hypothetical protein VFW83_09695 [Bryobacteraceae bacterium]|nr:hypothetical protein [Bryobacteraceae bacterium]